MALAMGLATYAGAQVPEGEDLEGLINFSYSLDSGFGGYSVSGRSVQVVKIPLSHTLRKPGPETWGLKLTFPIGFGVHEFKAVLDEGVRPLDTLRTITFVPGFEFEIPIGADSALKPFGELGFVRETSRSGSTAPIWSVGVRSLTATRNGSTTVSVGTGLEWSGIDGRDGLDTEDLGLFEMGVEVKLPTGASIKGKQLDWSAYVVVRQFLTDLTFERVGATPVEIDGQIETLSAPNGSSVTEQQ